MTKRAWRNLSFRSPFERTQSRAKDILSDISGGFLEYADGACAFRNALLQIAPNGADGVPTEENTVSSFSCETSEYYRSSPFEQASSPPTDSLIHRDTDTRTDPQPDPPTHRRTARPSHRSTGGRKKKKKEACPRKLEQKQK